MQTDLFNRQSATFSPCRRYRYTLWRWWGDGPYCMFVGLNPSTADETLDDPTVRRCIGYARDWGYSGLCMTNLFSFRATLPRDMKACAEPIGNMNNAYLRECALRAGIVIAAWGKDGGFRGRDREVVDFLPPLHYLRLNKDGSPAHPLYLPKSLRPSADILTLP